MQPFVDPTMSMSPIYFIVIHRFHHLPHCWQVEVREGAGLRPEEQQVFVLPTAEACHPRQLLDDR